MVVVNFGILAALYQYRWNLDVKAACKELFIIVLGISIALWMEGKAQDWEDLDRQNEYLERISDDLNHDLTSIDHTIESLDKKVENLNEAIKFLLDESVDSTSTENQVKAMNITHVINTYYFFTPQDFTYLSMRESGDFKLIRDNTIKSKLIELYRHYTQIKTLQNYFQNSIREEFVPFWMREVDLLNQQLVDEDMTSDPIFKNMVIFAVNDAQARLSQLKRIKQEIQFLNDRIKVTVNQKAPNQELGAKTG